jgi:hypothetical protein
MYVYKYNEVLTNTIGLIPVNDYYRWIKNIYHGDTEQIINAEKFIRCVILRCVINLYMHINLDYEKTMLGVASICSLVQPNKTVPLMYLVMNIDCSYSVCISDFELSAGNKKYLISPLKYEENKLHKYIDKAVSYASTVLNNELVFLDFPQEEINELNPGNEFSNKVHNEDKDPFNGINIKDFDKPSF